MEPSSPTTIQPGPLRSRVAIEKDPPRDTGRTDALPAPSTTTRRPPSLSSSLSSPSRLHPPSGPVLPRLPQSRFSFEYQYPLRNNLDRPLLYDRPHRLSPVEIPPPSSPLDAGSTVCGKSTLYSQQAPPDGKRRMPSSTATFIQGRTRTDNPQSARKGAEISIADESRAKSEDIFLNIARSDSGRRESLGRSDLRRSRLRMSGNGFRSSTSRVPDQTPSSPEQLVRVNTDDSPLHHSQPDPPSVPLASAPYSYSASAHALPNFASSTRSVVGLPRSSRLSRTGPEHETTPERRSSRHSTLSTIRSSRQVSGAEATERARGEPDRARPDGTESTLSTAAPSTVWDELEDLKSRIKKLELTGKLPPSSQEAIIPSAAGERPRTATTTVTTMSSSSPRHRRTSVSVESDTITAPSPIVPLLQSALGKAKGLASKEVYTALEATATDAIALSSLLGTGHPPSGGVSMVNGFGSTERQSRRKAESLCLALSDEPHLHQQQASGDDATLRMSTSGTDEGTVTPGGSYRCSINPEPDAMVRRPSAPRALSRLEARRASLATPGDHASKNSDALADPPRTLSPEKPAATSRLSRLSVSLRTKRLLPDDDEPAEPARSPQAARSISRRMTDIGGVSSAQRPPPPTRSRPSQSIFYPPTQASQPRTPTPAAQSGIPLRRSMMTTSLYTPATSRANILAGSRRYAPSSATAEVLSEDPPPSPRQPVSQTKIVAPSTKLAASYTPISQNRLRTNSLGARRFGMRQRPIATAGNSKSFDNSID
ncbi:hypothetical protein P175DRAFT_0513920 [Aspergillus ochraceoroseus IBT 24754]|uniref:LPXTG-motif cell wall anchor domain protein n=1 Tax=Aspergillus ochraceoroseus IBT 24754 TaxID=1392256 RepID=A0A2T5M9B8_9EURO|nr:uncharacterized protein P175DRAFT_0513920 [Aspergillus ochraceoroseus IBT 24754]PTU25117.1 hypothetical protein P175DRAFT_0513920 [Aspergillus ochraceoroseus IBT 24754]